MEDYDIIIVGSGPAGLTAGLYSGRQGNKTLIIEQRLVGGLGLTVPLMENYPGFESVEGRDLIQKMENQTKKVAEINIMETVTKIEKIQSENYNFKVRTDKDEYRASAVILATGSKHRKLKAEGEGKFFGRGVTYCATCDGPLFVDRDVVMVGGGNSAAQESVFLDKIGCKVSLIHRRDKLRCEDYLVEKLNELGINVYFNSTVKEIAGDQFVEKVIIEKDGKEIEIPTSAVFIAIGDIPSTELAEELGVDLNEDGYIVTDKEQRTNIPYLYSAGDVTGGIKQWVVSCGEGAVAALIANQDISKINVVCPVEF